MILHDLSSFLMPLEDFGFVFCVPFLLLMVELVPLTYGTLPLPKVETPFVDLYFTVFFSNL